jgi:hypothetical protein
MREEINDRYAKSNVPIALPALFAFAAGIGGAPTRAAQNGLFDRYITFWRLSMILRSGGTVKSEASGSARTMFVSLNVCSPIRESLRLLYTIVLRRLGSYYHLDSRARSRHREKC